MSTPVIDVRNLQRLSIALALVGNARVAVLDEPTSGVTIVLVTHFMAEAERLCDRLAVIDRGCVVVVDTPAALAERVEAEQRIQFRPSVPMDDRLLAGLPDVTGVVRRGDTVLVTGNANAETAAMLAVGLLVAAIAPTGRVAQIIGPLACYPMIFFAGRWIPLPSMPTVLRDISLATPLGAAVWAVQDATVGVWPHPVQLVTMVVWAAVFGVAAAKLFRWE